MYGHCASTVISQSSHCRSTHKKITKPTLHKLNALNFYVEIINPCFARNSFIYCHRLNIQLTGVLHHQRPFILILHMLDGCLVEAVSDDAVKETLIE